MTGTILLTRLWRLELCVVLWVASIVDLRVFRQAGYITHILNCNDCHVFESNKYLLLLLLLPAEVWSGRYITVKKERV